MAAETASEREIEWQLDAQDLRLVLRWIEVAAESANGIEITPGRTVTNRDTYVDTADRRLDRAGSRPSRGDAQVARLRRDVRPPHPPRARRPARRRRPGCDRAGASPRRAA